MKNRSSLKFLPGTEKAMVVLWNLWRCGKLCGLLTQKTCQKIIIETISL